MKKLCRLYHYIHCPFCVRVRMALGFLGMSYESIVLPYNDEATPLRLTGKKMLPALDLGDGKVINESLEIIKLLDNENRLQVNLLDSELQKSLKETCEELGEVVHSLCMPYFVYTPEFDDKSREYYVKKKEIKRGPFHLLVQKRQSLELELEQILMTLEKQLTPFYQSERLTIFDIQIAAHIWGLYILPEFQFTPKMHQYLQNIKKLCQFSYHQDFGKFLEKFSH